MQHPPASAGAQIALLSLDPLLTSVVEALEDAGVHRDAAFDVLFAVCEGYNAGFRDGQRDAVAQIAPEAARLGLDLRLAPDLEAPRPELS